VQHILPKGFHRIRYYGLHATCKAKQVKGVLTALMGALGRLIKRTYRIVAQKTYRERVLASTGRDPLRCARCGREMMLWQVWHRVMVSSMTRCTRSSAGGMVHAEGALQEPERMGLGQRP
jgi:Putative transposase